MHTLRGAGFWPRNYQSLRSGQNFDLLKERIRDHNFFAGDSGAHHPQGWREIPFSLRDSQVLGAARVS